MRSRTVILALALLPTPTLAACDSSDSTSSSGSFDAGTVTFDGGVVPPPASTDAGSDAAVEASCPAGPLPDLLHPRIYASAVFAGTDLYVIGGYDGPDNAKHLRRAATTAAC